MLIYWCIRIFTDIFLISTVVYITITLTDGGFKAIDDISYSVFYFVTARRQSNMRPLDLPSTCCGCVPCSKTETEWILYLLSSFIISLKHTELWCMLLTNQTRMGICFTEKLFYLFRDLLLTKFWIRESIFSFFSFFWFRITANRVLRLFIIGV